MFQITMPFTPERRRPVWSSWMSSSEKPNVKFMDRALRSIAITTGVLAIFVSAIPTIYESLEKAKTPAAARAILPDAREMTARATMKLERIPEIPPHQYVPQFNRLDVLADPERRISEEFLIPPGLLNRVGFWFDVYSRYDSNKRVIHYSLYPWVIFKIVDVEPIVNATYPRFRWMRNEVADALVKKETAKIRKALTSISKKKRLKDLDDSRLSADEIMVRDALVQLGGDVRRLAKRARREVRVQTGQRDFMAEGIQTAPRYLTAMEEIFQKHGLPKELTRLPLVESSFNKHAESKVGAMGVWQFMESSGKRQKLVVNNLIDERKSIYKSTHAAANQLKENHLILHRSWALAVTAWNHGPNGVRKAYRAAGTKDISRIIELYHSKSFSFASENFYAEFLAALYTERYADQIFPGLPRHAPLVVQELRLTRKMKVDDILRVAAITLEEFVGMNPDLAKLVKLKRPLQKGLRIHVPSDARSAVEYLMSGAPDETRPIASNR
jgi:membrane-bound lytic murein transglycosylase D